MWLPVILAVLVVATGRVMVMLIDAQIRQDDELDNSRYFTELQWFAATHYLVSNIV